MEGRRKRKDWETEEVGQDDEECEEDILDSFIVNGLWFLGEIIANEPKRGCLFALAPPTGGRRPAPRQKIGWLTERAMNLFRLGNKLEESRVYGAWSMEGWTRWKAQINWTIFRDSDWNDQSGTHDRRECVSAMIGTDWFVGLIRQWWLYIKVRTNVYRILLKDDHKNLTEDFEGCLTLQYIASNVVSHCSTMHQRLSHTAVQCIEGCLTLQYNALKVVSHCSTMHRRLSHTAVQCIEGCLTLQYNASKVVSHCSTMHRRLSHTAVQCIKGCLTLQYNASKVVWTCLTLQYNASKVVWTCLTLQYNASKVVSHCSTMHRRLSHTAVQYIEGCLTLQYNASKVVSHSRTLYQTLPHTASHCIEGCLTLQHTASNCS